MAYNGSYEMNGTSSTATNSAPENQTPQNQPGPLPTFVRAIENGPLYRFENGRYYGTFRGEQNLLPVDEEELERLDIFHQLILETRARDSCAGGLHEIPISPPPNHPLRILDLGCGTGIWSIDMADRYPNANVLGWDLNYCQPKKVPGNIRYEQHDITDPHWDVEPDHFDLIHMSMLAGSVRNWPGLYQNIFRHLKAGSGIFEHIEVDFRPQCSDGSLSPGAAINIWARELYAAYDSFGQPMVIHPDPELLLRQVGFVEVKHKVKSLPFHPWPEDEHDKQIGRWVNLAMTKGLSGMTMAPLTRLRGFPQEQVDALTAAVSEEISHRAIQMWCTLHIWTARKAPQPLY